MKIRGILVDDEQIARDILRNYLKKYCPIIDLVGEAENIIEAEKLINDLEPELVFLDVEMPYGNAFDLLERCQNKSFETIFITAYSEYSLKALNMSASYYLLKPLSIEELVQAVDKVSDSISKKQDFNKTEVLLKNLNLSQNKQQIILPTLNGFDVEKVEDIIRFQANGNFTDVYLKDKKKKMICKFLKHFEELLDLPFIRVHRSHIINLDYVKSYSKSLGGYLTLNDESEVEVSNTYKDKLISYFNN